MARYAAAAAGLALGAVAGILLPGVGVLLGAQIGLALGGIAGGLLFPEKTKTPITIGPRLDDLKVTASTYGTAIPWVWGVTAVSGNIIWARPIREEYNYSITRGGGKGGGGGRITGVTVWYTYFGDFAVGLCRGPIQNVKRIWLDGRVYSVENGTLLGMIATGDASCTIYLGTEDQLPDPWIEALEGVGAVPAYRGLAYLVFKNIPLKEFGNRIPQIKVELEGNSRAVANVHKAIGTNWRYQTYAGEFGQSLTNYKPYYIPQSSTLLTSDVYYLGDSSYVYPTYDVKTNPGPYSNIHDFANGDGHLIRTFTEIKTLYPFISDSLQDSDATWPMPVVPMSITFFNADTLDNSTTVITPTGGYPYASMAPYAPDYDPYTGDIWQMCWDRPSLGFLLTLARFEAANGYAVAEPVFITAGLYDGKFFFTPSYILFHASLIRGPAYYLTWRAANVMLRFPRPAAGQGLGETWTETQLPLDIDPDLYVLNQGFRYRPSVTASNMNCTDGRERLWILRSLGGSAELYLYDATTAAVTNVTPWSNHINGVSANYIPMLFEHDYTNDRIVIVYNDPGTLATYCGTIDCTTLAYTYHGVIMQSPVNQYVASYYRQGGAPVANITKAFVPSPVLKGPWRLVGGIQLDAGVQGSSSNRYTIAFDANFNVVESYNAFSANIFPDGSTLDLIEAYQLAITGGRTITVVDTTTLNFVASIAGNEGAWPSTAPLNNGIDPDLQGLDLVDAWAILPASNLGNSVANVVRDICIACGAEPANVNTTALGTVAVRGYMVTRESSGRVAIEGLQDIYQFDGVDRSGVLTFIYRNTGPTDYIYEIDQGTGTDPNQYVTRLTESRTQDIELPAQVNLKYPSYALDYQVAATTASRWSATNHSQNPLSLETVVVCTDYEAFAFADRYLWTQWQTRTTFSGSLPLKYIRFDPGDVVYVQRTDANGTYYIVTYIVQLDFGADGLVNFTGVGHDNSVFFPSDVGAPTPNPRPPGPGSDPVSTEYLYIDGPLLTEDDDANYGFYVVAGRYAPTDSSQAWPGSYTFKSSDAGVPGLQIGVNGAEAPMGRGTFSVRPQLDSFGGFRHELIDRTNILTVTIPALFDLESCTEEEMLGGKNRAMIAKELIGWSNALLVSSTASTKTYQLTNLLRYLMGTGYDVFYPASTHGNENEPFVPLDSTWVSPAQIDAGDAGVARYYRVVQADQDPTMASGDFIVMRSKKFWPISPVHITGHYDGNPINPSVSISWMPCARKNISWRDSIETVIDEEQESYRIQFALDPSGFFLTTGPGAPVRSEIVTGRTYTYTSAQMLEDWGTTRPQFFYVGVSQISTRTGGGRIGWGYFRRPKPWI